jgi:uncharacterized membrane protein (UPF0127 family)
MVLVNATKNTVLSDRCHFANSVFKRMIGLLNRKALALGEGLLIDRCYGIHTVGMRFPLDVLFMDKDLRVMRAVASLAPYRTCIVRKAVYVLELPVGAIQRTRTEEGDQIQFRSSESEPMTSLRISDAVGKVPA